MLNNKYLPLHPKTKPGKTDIAKYINYINMFNFLKPQKHLMLATCSMLLACGFSSCSKYDLDENNPEGWGESIYSYLKEQGNFTNTTRLIDDLGLTEVLAKTGSKTVFAANDEAFQRFYASNEWGVRKYEDLSESQKCLLLNGSVINNSYQINDLSSVQGPIEGQCMRRLSSQNPGDTLALVNVADLPNMEEKDRKNNPTWLKLKEENLEKIYLLQDATVPPMIHFIEDYLANNKITNDDYNFLYNYTTNRIPGDASINGKKIVQQNIKCSNGFIHVVQDVMQPLKSIASIVNSKPQASEWNSLMMRFAVPRRITDENRIRTYQNRADRDFNKYRLYEQRFFSKKSQGGVQLNTDDENKIYAGLLKFDPGWNTYYTGVVTSSEEVAMQKNMSVMMVPSNAAHNEYFTNQEGKVLLEEYGTLDKVPNDVIVELVNNNMLSSFSESVPSKFSGILNDANDPMGVDVSAIDSVWLGCNGAVYLTNKVYSPTSFVSVLYPAIVKENFKIMRKAVEMNQYNVYLNSLNSRYSLFIPDSTAFQCYIDPVSYGKNKRELCRFHYDKEQDKVRAWTRVIESEAPDGTFVLAGDSTEIIDPSNELIKMRLKDVLDNHIVIGDVEDGNEYYRTKGGQEIRINGTGISMKVAGSRQTNEDEELQVSDIYDQTKSGNGKVYILKKPIMTTGKNVMDMLEQMNQAHPNTCNKFRDLLKGSGLYEKIRDNKYACIKDSNLSVLNSYHYTIYVPQNSSLAGYKTWEQVEEMPEGSSERAADSTKIMDMLLLHIQDGSLFIGSKPVEEDGYETALVDKSTEKFVRIYAELTNSDLTVRKSLTSTNKSKVLKTYSDVYNLMAREYVANGLDLETATGIQSSATAVIHLIDKPIE